MHGTFSWRNHRLSYLKSGQGPVLIFLHNGGTDHTTWRKQIEHFSRNHTVYALDFLGYGQSDRPAEPYSLDFQVEQLDAFLQDHSLRRPVLVGNCVGASTAIEFARKYPDRVDRLALFNVFVGAAIFPPLAGLTRFPCLLKPLTWLYAKMVFNPSHLWGSPPAEADVLLIHLRQNVVGAAGFVRQRYYMILGAVTFGKFGGPLDLPGNFPRNILFWGTQNRVLPLRFSDNCRAYLKSERFVCVEGGGHLCFYEKAELVNEELEKFFRS